MSYTLVCAFKPMIFFNWAKKYVKVYLGVDDTNSLTLNFIQFFKDKVGLFLKILP